MSSGMCGRSNRIRRLQTSTSGVTARRRQQLALQLIDARCVAAVGLSEDRIFELDLFLDLLDDRQY